MSQIVFVLSVSAVYTAISLYICRKIKLKVTDLAIGGIICALTLVLSYIMIPLPTGATITCGAMVPIMLLSLIYNHRLAIVCGWICGVLSIMILPLWKPVHWAQIFIEHMVCFSCLGYAGVFGTDKKWKVICGCSIAGIIKYAAHVFSGVVFFSQNSWTGWGTWSYSILYNLSSTLPEILISAALLIILPTKSIRTSLARVKS